MISKEKVVEKLKDCYDPEIPINLYDLGLIYDVRIDEPKGVVEIDMTLTSVGCPVAPIIIAQVQEKVKELDGVKLVMANLVWEPAWNPSKATDEGKTQLRYMGINI